MARPKKQVKAKEPVRLRFNKLKNGNTSVYLDIYHNGRRSYQFLKLYLVPETDVASKIQNVNTLATTNAIKAEKILELTNKTAGITDRSYKAKMLLTDWMKISPIPSPTGNTSTSSGRRWTTGNAATRYCRTVKSEGWQRWQGRTPMRTSKPRRKGGSHEHARNHSRDGRHRPPGLRAHTPVHPPESYGDLRLPAGNRAGGRHHHRHAGQLQRISREAQKQEDIQLRRHCRRSLVRQEHPTLQGALARREAQGALRGHGTKQMPLPQGVGTHPPTGRHPYRPGNGQAGVLHAQGIQPQQRRQIINHALTNDPEIGFVVIDGIRDLMYDINSSSESVDLINDLMRWSSMHDLHIHTVLHLNKGDDNTRGHIGTELNNKAKPSSK